MSRLVLYNDDRRHQHRTSPVGWIGRSDSQEGSWLSWRTLFVGVGCTLPTYVDESSDPIVNPVATASKHSQTWARVSVQKAPAPVKGVEPICYLCVRFGHLNHGFQSGRCRRENSSATRESVSGLRRNLCVRNDLLAMCPVRTLELWRAREDSNLRPSAPQADALSTELRARLTLDSYLYPI